MTPSVEERLEELLKNRSPALQTAVIQKGVTRVDDNAFSHCPNLASATVAKTVLSIGKLAF
jgi:hypothetical protein